MVLFLAFSAPFTFCLCLAAVGAWSYIYSNRWDVGALNMSLGRCIEQNQWYRVFTSLFVHRNPMHLLVNVLALWGCLARVESVYGSWFVFRYSVLIVAVETVLTLFWIRLAVEVFQKRRAIEVFISSSFARLSCREPMLALRDINIRALFDRLWLRIRNHFSAEQDADSSQSHLSAEHPPPPAEEVYERDRHPFSLVRSHPLTLEPVCGIGCVCLAWLVFAVVQDSTGESLMPLASAGEIALTQNYLHTRTDGDVQDTDAVLMAKYALANTGYPIFGLFNLDPALAPLIFLLVTRFVAPITASDQDGAMALLVQTTSSMRYLLHIINGFLLGLFLGADVLTAILPNVYWTLCFFGNCTLLGLNSLASNNAILFRRAFAVEGNDMEFLLSSRRAAHAGNNILGLDLNPEMFDCPTDNLISRRIDAGAVLVDEPWPLDLEEADAGFVDRNDDEENFHDHGGGVGMVQRIRSTGASASAAL